MASLSVVRWFLLSSATLKAGHAFHFLEQQPDFTVRLVELRADVRELRAHPVEPGVQAPLLAAGVRLALRDVWGYCRMKAAAPLSRAGLPGFTRRSSCSSF